MQSTFSGIEIGKKALITHQRGLSTVGHNLSNASSEGYSRQRVQLGAVDPIYQPQLNRAETAGQIGQGVQVQSIERVRDQLLEGRIVAQANGEGYWEARDKYLLMVEQVYNEPSDSSVRGLMDRFWEGWQELSIHPEQMATRSAVVQRGEAVIEGIQQRYQRLDRIRTMLDDDIRGTVEQVNNHLTEIAELNQQIVKSEAAGDNPNDLLDRRDLLVERLSGLIDITVDNRDPDEFSVHTAGFHVIQGGIARPFRIEPDPGNEGLSNVVWSHSGEDAHFRGGKLAALVELRDDDVRGEIQNLDNMAINFIDLVNEVHSAGVGLNGETGNDFFVEYPRVLNGLGNYDQSGDGEFDRSYLFRITGANELQAQQQVGLAGTMTLPGPEGQVQVQYAPTDTVSDIIARVNNSRAEVVARLDRNNRLTLKATPAANMENPDFVIRDFQDSGNFLAGYSGILQGPGAENGYTWQQADAVLGLQGGELDYAVAPLQHPAGWIEVNEELKNEPAAVAAALPNESGEGVGNGEAAGEIAAIRNQAVMVGQVSTFEDYFADTVAEIGLKGEQAREALETNELIMKDLRDMRASISGVNVDEEVAEMIKFQHGYQAAARFVSQIDTMLNTIINRMGV
jgi:flagellar hook-associated protein 1 FlgK